MMLKAMTTGDDDEDPKPFDEEEELLREEGITAAKLAFLVPLVSRIYAEPAKSKNGTAQPDNAGIDTNLKTVVATFFKDAICPDFITVSQIGLVGQQTTSFRAKRPLRSHFFDLAAFFWERAQRRQPHMTTRTAPSWLWRISISYLVSLQSPVGMQYSLIMF